MDRCPVALFSFTRVNVFLLQVYWETPACTSCKLMISADGSHIIRMYEARRGEGDRAGAREPRRSSQRVLLSDEVVLDRIARGGTA